MPKLREQMNRKVAFLNKFDVAVQYKNVLPTTQNFFNWGKAILKSWNFWNTEVEFKNNRESQILATIVIDPLTHEHVNVTLKTPTETIRVNSFSLPMKVKPFKLVSPGQSSVDSFTDIVRSYATESRAECKVDSRKVRTFDDVTIKAPLTKCYTVLAKDCENESPRFAVLMKKINNQDKVRRRDCGQVCTYDFRSSKCSPTVTTSKSSRNRKTSSSSRSMDAASTTTIRSVTTGKLKRCAQNKIQICAKILKKIGKTF